MRSKKNSYESTKSKRSGPRGGLVGAPSHPSICLTPMPPTPTLWCSLSVLCSRWTPKPLLAPTYKWPVPQKTAKGHPTSFPVDCCSATVTMLEASPERIVAAREQPQRIVDFRLYVLLFHG